MEGLGYVAHPLPPQRELSQLAHPFYHSLARGGEGHLEVGKNVYYTVHHLCHMVLALKTFRVHAVRQSDGVQSLVISRFPEMIFLPIETAGEGEINAHSRVQMALGEAKAKAEPSSTVVWKAPGSAWKTFGTTLPNTRNCAARLPGSAAPDVAGVAANFVLHVNELMSGKARRISACAPTGERKVA